MHDDLARSVLAVPPLARRADLTLDHAANRALIRHIERGGIATLIYGGNANLYNRTKTNTNAQAAPDSPASAMSSGKANS